MLLGRVTDFLDVGAWPIFNVADASIVTGLVLLGWIFVPGGREAKRDEVGNVLEAGGRSNQAMLEGSYSLCPVCDGDMRPAGMGWRCSTCGARERN